MSFHSGVFAHSSSSIAPSPHPHEPLFTLDPASAHDYAHHGGCADLWTDELSLAPGQRFTKRGLSNHPGVGKFTWSKQTPKRWLHPLQHL